jgi:hypothetical protein
MLRRVNLIASVGGVVVALLSTVALQAGTIAVPDYSFENPDVSADPYYATFPNISLTTPSNDVWAGPGYSSGVVLNGKHSRAYTNLVGSQCGWMDTTAGAHPVFMDLTAATFEVGKAYKLTIGVGGMADGWASDKLDVALYARPDGSNLVTAASTIATYGELSITQTMDYVVNVPVVQSTDAWAGKSIGILLNNQGGNHGTAACWNFDNVRLESSAVPEPGTIVLLIGGMSGLLAYAWRKR